MSLVINFYGGPGTGKSTSAAAAFAHLKQLGISCELVTEYVKQWAWENRKPVNLDQFYIFGKQARKEYSLHTKVDVIITDSPVSLCAYYTKIFGTEEQASCFKTMTKTYYNTVDQDGHEYFHVWLNRLKAYDPKGRFQTEAEARQIDGDMRMFVQNDLGLTLTPCNADNKEVCRLVEQIVNFYNKDIK